MQKILKVHGYALAAAVMIACATLLRVVLVLLGWPVTNGDEAITHLMALHIMKGELPIFFYGQNYLGAFEAYATALIFRLFGLSLLSMRLESILTYSAFLVCMYLIVSRLYTRSLALVTVALLGLASQWIFIYQLMAIGYTPLPFLCALLFLLSYQLVCSQRAWYWRAVYYLLWGVVAGLAFWAHLTVAPYVLVSGLLLIVAWRPLLKYGLWFAIIGFVIGAWPLIYYNLHAAPGSDSLSTFLNVSSMGAVNHYSLEGHLSSSFVVTLPATLGLGPSCYIEQWPYLPLSYPHTRMCLLTQEAYGIGYVILLIVATTMACGALFTARRYQIGREWVQHLARLLLLVGSALTLFGFARQPAAVFNGVLGVRYLICTLVSLPAVLWALWKGLEYARVLLPQIGARTLLTVRLGVVLILCLISLNATVHTFARVPVAQAEQQQFVQLADRLEALHITRFFSEYWTCNPLIFQTQERLVCADTWGNLTHGLDRYIAYRAMVLADPNPGFVYPVGSNRILELVTALTATHTPYRLAEVPGFVIYQPAHRIPGVQLYAP